MNCPKCGEDWSDVAVVRNAKREALAPTPAPLDVERLAMAVNKASHYPDPVNEHVRKLARAIAAAYAEEAECD